MNTEEYITSWKQLIWRETADDRLTLLEGFPGVILTNEIIEDIYNQLIALKDKNVVYFVPGDDDVEIVSDKQIPTTQIIGSLVDVAKKQSENYLNEHVFVKVNIEDKFKYLPFRGYELNIGLQSDKIVWNDTPVMYRDCKKHSIKSCVVKGLYWHSNRNFNHVFGKNHCFSYYNLRNLNMYVYEPGRCYW